MYRKYDNQSFDIHDPRFLIYTLNWSLRHVTFQNFRCDEQNEVEWILSIVKNYLSRLIDWVKKKIFIKRDFAEVIGNIKLKYCVYLTPLFFSVVFS